MEMTNQKNRLPAVATISILCVHEKSAKLKLLLQRRSNPKEIKQYNGLWEIPQGKIYAGEHIIDAAKRELMDEAGLELVELVKPTCIGNFYDFGGFSTQILSFYPCMCCQSRGNHSHLSLAIVAKVRGEPHKTNEAYDHKWYSIEEILKIINHNQLFPLNIPMVMGWIYDFTENSSVKEKLITLNLIASDEIRPRPWLTGQPTICFDLGGVMISHRHEPVFNNLARAFNVTDKDIRRYLVSSGILDEFNIGEVDEKDIYKKLVCSSQNEIGFKAFMAAWESGVMFRHENIKILNEIRKLYCDFQFAAATNLDIIKHRYIMKTQAWYASMDYRHVSCIVKDRKPNVSYYEKLCFELACEPKDIFFVDDKRSNLQSAKEIGIETFNAKRTKPLGSYFLSKLDNWLQKKRRL